VLLFILSFSLSVNMAVGFTKKTADLLRPAVLSEIITKQLQKQK